MDYSLTHLTLHTQEVSNCLNAIAGHPETFRSLQNYNEYIKPVENVRCEESERYKTRLQRLLSVGEAFQSFLLQVEYCGHLCQKFL